MKLTRGQKIFYGFALAGCFLAMGIVDRDAVKDAEAEAARAEWIAEMNARQLLEEKEEFRPQVVSAPAFVGKPNYDKQFAMLREEHAKRVSEKN